MSEELKKRIENEIKDSKNSFNLKKGVSVLSEVLIRQIMSAKHEVGLLRDEKGMPIPGTGRVITEEEKKAVLAYIKRKEYPFTNKMYAIILSGYVNGEIDLEETMEKSHKL